MSDLLYRKPRILVLLLALIVVSGLGALQVLPRSEDPELTPRNAAIFAPLPGASALRVEALVTEPIEDALAELEEIRKLDTSSRAGLAVLQVELNADVDDVDQVWSRVRDKLSDVQRELPPGAPAPELEEFEIAAYTLILGLTWELEGEPQPALLSRLAEDLADRLRGLGGTQEAEVFGEVQEQVQVLVDPARLARLGLSVAQVAAATREADAKVPAGTLEGSAEELLIEVAGELDSLERVSALPVRVDPDGRVVRVADVGQVRKGFQEPRAAEAFVSGRSAVVVAVRMQSGQRVDLWTADALRALEQAEADLPRGVALRTLFQQSRYTEQRLADLFANFGMGAGLVVLVILFMMGWRAAILVGLALPLTTLMVFQGMRVLGIPIQQMSVTGLIIALGLLIDNAIVIVDEVRHNMAEGLSPREAVRQGVGKLAVPLMGSTATTVFAFMPIVLMPGNAGEFVGSMALSVILAILSSLFLALLVTPALTARFGQASAGPRRPGLLGALGSQWTNGFHSRLLLRVYRGALGLLMRVPVLALVLAALLPALGLWRAGSLPEQFFPPADRDQFALELVLPQQSSLEATRAAMGRADTALREHPRVSDVHWFLGESAPKFYYNFVAIQRDAANYAQALVQLDGPTGSLGVVRELQVELDQALPEVLVLAKQIEQGPPFEAPVELLIYGNDLTQLRQVGEELRAELAELPAVTHTKALLESGRPKLHLELDEEAARLAGWDNRALAAELQGALEGLPGGSVLEATEELPVVVRLAEQERGDLQRLASLPLSRASAPTTLDALGQLELRPELAAIPHRGGLRCNRVQAFLEAGSLPAETLDALLGRLEARGFEPPPGTRLEIGGESAERDRAVGDLASTAAVLLVAMGASLVLAFSSFRLAALVACVGALAVGLSLGSLWLFGYPFGFMAIVGTMGLIGVAINDSIVVLAALQQDEACRQGSREAVVDVVVRASRHVLSTTLTTAAGFLPLWLAGGGFWPPVAVAIGFGVLGATFLALTFVPAAYLLVRPRRAAAQGRASSSPRPVPSPA